MKRYKSIFEDKKDNLFKLISKKFKNHLTKRPYKRNFRDDYTVISSEDPFYEDLISYLASSFNDSTPYQLPKPYDYLFVGYDNRGVIYIGTLEALKSKGMY